MTRKFIVCTEGATADGREIPREWIEQAAANYSPTKYGARINLEHMRGLFADYMPALGDVVSLSTATSTELGKLQLIAELDPTSELINLTSRRQKIYTSCEFMPKFADTGEAYLVGLAVTDSPSSLGTEALKFSAVAGRKQQPDNVFTTAIELQQFTATSQLPEDTPMTGTTQPTMSEKLRSLFSVTKQETPAADPDFATATLEAIENIYARINDLDTKLTANSQPNAADAAEIANLRSQVESLSTQVAELSAVKDESQRSAATGQAPITTDC